MSENSQHIGYKKCRDGRIVVLEILGKHNEDREGIVDEQFAKMRCSRARVIRIYDMHDQTIEYDEAFGIYDKTVKYTVGEVVEPIDEFDNYLDKVCGSGIHYFLTEEPAYYWEYKPKNGLYKSWYESGQVWERFTSKNGELDGLYEEWRPNGQILSRWTCKNGELDGLYESWYSNGQMRGRCTYRNGEKDGLCESWHENGQMRRRYEYVNGEVDGLYETWHSNGQMRARYSCVNGEPDGLFESWLDNGQMWELCMYENGMREDLYEE